MLRMIESIEDWLDSDSLIANITGAMMLLGSLLGGTLWLMTLAIR